MSPAVAVAMPQYTNATSSSAANGGGGGGTNNDSSGNINHSSSANNGTNDFSYGMKDGGGGAADSWNMDSALDFDLLAAYLLEDVSGGGFDFR